MNREKVKFFEQIFEAIRVLLSTKSSLEEGMQAAIDIAKELGIERICVFLKDENEQMTLVRGYPPNKHGMKNRVDIERHPGLKEIMERKKMLIVKNPVQDKRSACTPEFCKLHEINASLFVRIEIDKKPVGAIVIDATGEKKKFDRDDVSVAKMISLLATKRIHNRTRDVRWERSKIFKLVAAELVHEVRNPTVVIGGFAQRLEKEIDKNPEKAVESAKIIIEETEKIEKIIKNSSELLNQGKIRKEKKSLVRITESLIKKSEQYALSRGKKIPIDFDKKNVPKIFLDEKQIEVALFQIFKNAIDAIVGRGDGEIFVKIWKRPHFVCLEIANTGSNIPKDELETIFTPFYTTKRGDGGIGLGLAIAQKIVEDHDGQIEVSSKTKPTESASFTIFLPI